MLPESDRSLVTRQRALILTPHFLTQAHGPPKPQQVSLAVEYNVMAWPLQAGGKETGSGSKGFPTLALGLLDFTTELFSSPGLLLAHHG